MQARNKNENKNRNRMIGKVWKFGLKYRASWDDLPEGSQRLAWCVRVQGEMITTSGIIYFNSNHRFGGVAHSLRVVPTELAAEPVNYGQRYGVEDFICSRDNRQLGSNFVKVPGRQRIVRLNVVPFFTATPSPPSQDDMDREQVSLALARPVYSLDGLPDDWLALGAAFRKGETPDMHLVQKYKSQLDIVAAIK